MRQIGGDQALELADEPMDSLGRKIECEEFDGDKTFAPRIVRAKHRPKGPCTDLMKNTKRSKRVWRRSADRFRVQ